MVERFSASGLCRMSHRNVGSNPGWDRGACVLQQDTLPCFSPPRSKLVTCEGRVGAEMAAIELYTPQGAEMVSGMIYAPDEQG